MKLNALVIALIATSTVPAFAGQAEPMDSECLMAVQSAVVAAQGGGDLDYKTNNLTITDEQRKTVTVSSVKEVAHSDHNDVRDMPSWSTYEASVGDKKTGGLVGKVRVTYTRGGCSVDKVKLDSK